jgi:putative endonuclease
VGRRGERAAARFLKRHGFRIVYRNFRVPRGELDLVARDGRELVFVEVKTRRRGHLRGRPLDAVDAGKQRRIVRAALAYLRLLGHPDVRFRFDVVEVYLNESGRHPECRLIQEAFGMPEGWRYMGSGE